MGLVRPLGGRSCGSGGTWDFARVDGGRLHVLTETEKFLTAFPSERERAMLKAELRTLMLRASRGQLRYGSASVGQVQQMVSVTDVLELRMLSRRTGAGDQVYLRFYFSEPTAHADLLLGLLLEWKSPDPWGREEQNQHALEAQRRFDDWAASG